MIKIVCMQCGEETQVKFTWSTTVGLIVKLPTGWLSKTDEQGLWCSKKCLNKQIDSLRTPAA